MRLSIIVAIGQNSELGYQNKLLWHISEDLKRFKRITSDHTVLVGQQTFESFGGKALPRRRNIVLSNEPGFTSEIAEIARSIDDALEMVQGEDEVFIIGGASIYKQMLPLATKMYLTRVYKEYKADTFFPEYNEEEWRTVESIDIDDDLQAGVKYSFVTLERIK